MPTKYIKKYVLVWMKLILPEFYCEWFHLGPADHSPLQEELVEPRTQAVVFEDDRVG